MEPQSADRMVGLMVELDDGNDEQVQYIPFSSDEPGRAE